MTHDAQPHPQPAGRCALHAHNSVRAGRRIRLLTATLSTPTHRTGSLFKLLHRTPAFNPDERRRLQMALDIARGMVRCAALGCVMLCCSVVRCAVLCYAAVVLCRCPGLAQPMRGSRAPQCVVFQQRCGLDASLTTATAPRGPCLSASHSSHHTMHLPPPPAELPAHLQAAHHPPRPEVP